MLILESVLVLVALLLLGLAAFAKVRGGFRIFLWIVGALVAVFTVLFHVFLSGMSALAR